MLLARRRRGNLNVLAESRQEVDEPADGEIASAVAVQGGDVRLLNAEDLRGLDLGQATVLMMRASWSVSRALVSS